MDTSEIHRALRALIAAEAVPLRYGENPHQQAFFLMPGDVYGVASARLLQGKLPSFNNVNDADAAIRCVAEFDPQRTAAVAIIKHANPCGVAEGKTLTDAYSLALRCDPQSAYGGIVACNRQIDADTARAIVQIFTEVVIAPDASDEALEVFETKKDLRVMLTDDLPDPRAKILDIRSVAGGLLIQTRDNAVVDDMKLKVVTKRQPTAKELADMKFAFRVVKHVKSNAIVYAKDGATVGIGAGQMSRVDSCAIGKQKAVDAAARIPQFDSLALDSVVASDAFFPFADGLQEAIEAGATAVIQPGGAMRDKEVIAEADKHRIAMVFTGVRHFRH